MFAKKGQNWLLNCKRHLSSDNLSLKKIFEKKSYGLGQQNRQSKCGNFSNLK